MTQQKLKSAFFALSLATALSLPGAAALAQTQTVTDSGPGIPVTAGEASITGTVVRTGDEQFILEVGTERLIVDTSGLDDEPLEEQGFRELQAGDVVTVVGWIEEGPRENRNLKADSVRTVSNQPAETLEHQGDTIPPVEREDQIDGISE